MKITTMHELIRQNERWWGRLPLGTNRVKIHEERAPKMRDLRGIGVRRVMVGAGMGEEGNND
jgi:hypothetical protein